MDNTSLSLFQRLQRPCEGTGWEELTSLYEPLLRAWLRNSGVVGHDADDVVQEVLLAVTRGLPGFVHNGRVGAFRAWLRSILVHRLRDYWRRRRREPEAAGGSRLWESLEQLADSSSPLSRLWKAEHDRYVARRLLDIAKPQFAEHTWLAFCRVALDGERPDVVAAELSMTANAVFVAKSRVLRRLRSIAKGFLEVSPTTFRDAV